MISDDEYVGRASSILAANTETLVTAFMKETGLPASKISIVQHQTAIDIRIYCRELKRCIDCNKVLEDNRYNVCVECDV